VLRKFVCKLGDVAGGAANIEAGYYMQNAHVS
jgi:hypothetical protein